METQFVNPAKPKVSWWRTPVRWWGLHFAQREERVQRPRTHTGRLQPLDGEVVQFL